MALTNDLYRIQYTFSLGSSGEVAVTGFHCRYAPDEGPSNEAAALLAIHAAAAWNSAWTSQAANFANTVRLIKTGAYHVVPAGGPSDFFSVSAIPTPDQWHGTTGDSLPWEDSLCLTLEGTSAGQPPLPHPRRYRGRAYLPPMTPGILSGGDGFVGTTPLGNILTAATAWLEAFNDSVSGTQARAVIMSRTGGFSSDVDHLSIDGQMDRQVRRQNRQDRPARVVGAQLDS